MPALIILLILLPKTTLNNIINLDTMRASFKPIKESHSKTIIVVCSKVPIKFDYSKRVVGKYKKVGK